jgi:[histone H3]-lysine36 N-dimethyltransferase SETMAR
MNFPKHYFRYLMLDQYYRMLPNDVNATQAAVNIQNIYGKDSTSERDCRKWFKRFKEGDYNLEDKPRIGRPSTVNEEQLEAVRKADTRQTQAEIGEQIGTSRITVGRHLKAMGVRWKYGRQDPHELTEENKADRLTICSALLSRHNRKKSFLSKIVTGDESWIFFVNMKRKRQHLRPGETGIPDVRPNPHRAKLMLCVFWDSKGVLYFELMDGEKTLNKEEYCRQLRELDQEIRLKRGENTKVVLHRDNAKPHIANMTKNTIQELGWEEMPHPAWSPDLAPSDYHLFRALKNSLAEIRFENLDHVQNHIKKFFSSRSRNFYKHGIFQLPDRWGLVVDSYGDYFDDSLLKEE